MRACVMAPGISIRGVHSIWMKIPYQIALIDHYDQRGELWRASEAHTINYYDVPTYWSSVESHMDLQSGRYVATGIDNQDPVNTFNVPLSASSYTPQALRTRGRR